MDVRPARGSGRVALVTRARSGCALFSAQDGTADHPTARCGVCGSPRDGKRTPPRTPPRSPQQRPQQAGKEEEGKEEGQRDPPPGADVAAAAPVATAATAAGAAAAGDAAAAAGGAADVSDMAKCAVFYKPARVALEWSEHRSRAVLAALRHLPSGRVVWVTSCHLEGAPHKAEERFCQLTKADYTHEFTLRELYEPDR
eukprot:gene9060-24798_t